MRLLSAYVLLAILVQGPSIVRGQWSVAPLATDPALGGRLLTTDVFPPQMDVKWPGPFVPGSALAPGLVSNFQGGTDNAYLYKNTPSVTGVTAPIFYIYPHFQFGQMFLGGAHNCAVLAFGLNSGYTVSSVTDSGSGSWQAGPSVTGNNHTLYAYYLLGTSANITSITISTSGTPTNPSSYPMTFFSPTLTEVRNCNTSGIGGTGTLDTPATGSAITLTLSSAPASGDMALAYFLDTTYNTSPGYGYPLAELSSISPGSGFTLLSASLSFGKAAEYNTATTSTSVPITYSGTDTILGVGLVIKQGPAGTALPSSMYVDHYQMDFSGSNTEILFPSSGDLLVGIVSGIQYYVTSVSGSTGTWLAPSACYAAIAGEGASQIFYAYGASANSSTNYTTTWNTQSAYSSEIGNASITNASSTAPFDACASSNGDQTTATNLTAVVYSPAVTNEMIFNATGVYNHTETGLATDSNSHTPVVISSTDSKSDDTGYCTSGTPASSMDEDDGWGWYTNASNTSAVTFIYSGTQNTSSCAPTGVGYWESVSAGFSSSAITRPTYVQSLNTTTSVAGSTGLAYSSNVTSGHALYAILFDGNGTSDTDAFSDSQGNTWKVVNSSGSLVTSGYTVNLATDGDTVAIGCAIAGSSAADTVKFTINGSGSTTAGLQIWEVANSTCTVDGGSSGISTADTTAQTACNTGQITTQTANDFLFVACGTQHNETFTVGSGWSNLTQQSSAGSMAGESQSGPIGNYTGTMSYGTSAEQGSAIIAFQP